MLLHDPNKLFVVELRVRQWLQAIEGNPVCKESQFKELLCCECGQAFKMLDGMDISAKERLEAHMSLGTHQ